MLTEWSVESGVPQGCIIAPIFFLMTTYRVLGKTSLFPQLEDLDCSDGLTVTGLNKNTSKPQMMPIKSPPGGPLTVDGTPLHVDEVKFPG